MLSPKSHDQPVIEPVDWSVNDTTSGAADEVNAAFGGAGVGGGVALTQPANASAATAITPMSARR